MEGAFNIQMRAQMLTSALGGQAPQGSFKRIKTYESMAVKTLISITAPTNI